MVNRYMERCLPSLIMEIQIKVTMRYHLPSVGMAIIKKIKDSNYWQGCREKRNPCTPLVGMKIGETPFKINFGIIYQIKIQIPFIRTSQEDS